MTQLPVFAGLVAYHGDTWSQVFRLKRGSTPENLNGATVACWATSKGQRITLNATITDAPGGEITLSAGDDGLPAGQFSYDVEVTKDGVVTTWIRGSLEVKQDVTNA